MFVYIGRYYYTGFSCWLPYLTSLLYRKHTECRECNEGVIKESTNSQGKYHGVTYFLNKGQMLVIYAYYIPHGVVWWFCYYNNIYTLFLF